MEEFPLLQLPAWIDLLAIGVGALAGAAGAVRLGFDLVGVLFVAIMMGLGGGIIRDLLLGIRPVAVTDQNYLVTAVAAGLGALVVLRLVNRWNQLFLVFDALALGLFTIVGVEKATLYGVPDAGAIFIGVVAAVGGGVIRDLISNQPVEIVRRGTWNAAAALVGAIVYVIVRELDGPVLASEIVAFVVIVGVRYSALHWGWKTSEASQLLSKVKQIPISTVKQIPLSTFRGGRWSGSSPQRKPRAEASDADPTLRPDTPDPEGRQDEQPDGADPTGRDPEGPDPVS
jgi:uncharacterized membrane protein YeiH